MVALLAARPALAQDLVEPEPEDLARFHTGPLHFTPSIAITDIGVDSNVFNQSVNERSDQTAAVGPAVNYWVRAGGARLAGRSFGQYLYFNEYENQRSWNSGHSLRTEFRLTHLKPFVFGSYLDTRDRPGFEIDTRARHTDTTLGFGTDLRLSGRTTVVVGASRMTTTFNQDETAFGETLATALDRDTTTESLQLRYMLTPLTTFVVTGEAIQDRFDLNNRDADSTRISAGFEFKPSALIAGKAAIGARNFDAFDPSIPDYIGPVVTADVLYTVARTQITAHVARDLSYSYQVDRPYYRLSDIAFSVTERITTSWDVVGRTGWQSLDYRAYETSPDQSPRTDRGRMYGAGVGYLLGNTARVGFDLNYYTRIGVIGESYEGFRMGGSVSYGSTQ